jgi:hypothetical protein
LFVTVKFHVAPCGLGSTTGLSNVMTMPFANVQVVLSALSFPGGSVFAGRHVPAAWTVDFQQLLPLRKAQSMVLPGGALVELHAVATMATTAHANEAANRTKARIASSSS